MWKIIRRNSSIQEIGSWVIAILIKSLAKSIRWDTHIPPSTEKLFRTNRPIILVFWHNRILSMTAGWDACRHITLLRSPHRDGLLIGRAIGHLGYKTIAGSSNNNGSNGLRKLLKELRQGISIGITPDGPRGPRMRLAMGTITAARLSGIPIIPVAWNVERRTLLGTWDKMILAHPFTNGVFVFGKPISIPKGLDRDEEEHYRLMVEEELNKVSSTSDLHYKHSPIEPGSMSPKNKQATHS